MYKAVVDKIVEVSYNSEVDKRELEAWLRQTAFQLDMVDIQDDIAFEREPLDTVFGHERAHNVFENMD